jgi:hypothetical protein
LSRAFLLQSGSPPAAADAAADAFDVVARQVTQAGRRAPDRLVAPQKVEIRGTA